MRKSILGLALTALLVACGETTATPDNTEAVKRSPSPEDSATVEATALNTPSTDASASTTTPAVTALPPATYCYAIDDEVLSGAVRLTVTADRSLMGQSIVTIHDNANSYYSSYKQDFEGDLQGDEANVSVTTWIEYDQQTSNETWFATATTLQVDNNTFVITDCSDPYVTQYFTEDDGITADDLLAGVTQPGIPVQFPPGTYGTTLENSVVRGDRDLYTLAAQGGQVMYLNITSVEDNAVFDVISPSQEVLVLEATNEELLLQETGNYQIIVGGTRGNATYFLDVAID